MPFFSDHRVNLKESEKWDKNIDLSIELKKTMEYEGDGDTNFNSCTRYSQSTIGTGTGELENKRTRGDHPNFRIVEIGQKSKKSPED